MSQFMQVVVDNLDVILSVVVGLLLFLITFLRTGSIKKSIKSLKDSVIFDYSLRASNLKGDKTMIKYRTEADDVKSPSQEFSETVTDYILDPVTNELSESDVPKDIQAYIDSHIDIALDRALQRFLPHDVIEDDDHYADYTQKSQDLAELGAAMDLAEDYREQFNLPDNYTFEQIMQFVGTKADELKTKLSQVQNLKKETVENVESKKKEIE